MLAPAAVGADRWFAAPGGGGTDCTAGNPCSAETAIETKAQPGDTVELAGGDYAVSSQLDALKRISIEGATGGAPARLIGAASVMTTLNYAPPAGTLPARISNLQLTNQYVGGGYAIVARDNNATGPLVVERISAEALVDGFGGQFWTQTDAEPVVRNSVFRGTRSALSVQGPGNGDGSLEVRNVTAVGAGATSSGMSVNAQDFPPCGAFVVTVKNSIFRGSAPANDVTASNSGMGNCPSTVNSSSSNWRAGTDPGTSTINSTGDQHSSEPLFANPAGGDFHQLAGSPTIDAGAAADLIGDTDIDGDPRTLGAAPDIGADEFRPPEVVVALGDVALPVGSALRFSPSRFASYLGRGSSVAQRRRRGSRVTYRLSEAAVVTFTVHRRIAGRRRGRRCITGRRARRLRSRRCIRHVAVRGSFVHAGRAGGNAFRFTGRVRRRPLRPGAYRLSGVAVDAAGNRGRPFRRTFRIVRRR